MGYRTIDFRSDTVTQPPGGMRQAMAEAAVGEDLHQEDATVNALSGLDAAGMSVALRQRGVLANPTDDGRLRFVTHYGHTEEDIDMAIRAIGETV